MSSWVKEKLPLICIICVRHSGFESTRSIKKRVLVCSFVNFFFVVVHKFDLMIIPYHYNNQQSTVLTDLHSPYRLTNASRPCLAQRDKSPPSHPAVTSGASTTRLHGYRSTGGGPAFASLTRERSRWVHRSSDTRPLQETPNISTFTTSSGASALLTIQ